MTGILGAMHSRVNALPSTEQVALFTRKTVTLIFWDVMLAWPRAVFYHTPLLIKEVKYLSDASKKTRLDFNSLKIHLIALSTLFKQSAIKASNIKHFIEKLEPHLRALDEDSLKRLMDHRGVQLRKFFTYSSEVLSKLTSSNAEDAASSDVEETNLIEEIVVLLELAQVLVDDFSERKGMMDAGKRRDMTGEDLSRAIRLQVRGAMISQASEMRRPSSASALHEVPSTNGAILTSSARGVSRPVHGAMTSLSSLSTAPVETSPLVEVPVLLESNLAPFTVSISSSTEFLRFIVVDVFYGLIKLVLLDLPHLVIETEGSLRAFCQKAPTYHQELKSLNNTLGSFEGLIQSFNILEPLLNALGSTLDSINLPRLVGDIKTLEQMMDQLESTLDKTSPELIERILFDIEKILKTTAPALIKLLDMTNGRSAAAIATPNPLNGFAKKGKEFGDAVRGLFTVPPGAPSSPSAGVAAASDSSTESHSPEIPAASGGAGGGRGAAGRGMPTFSSLFGVPRSGGAAAAASS